MWNISRSRIVLSNPARSCENRTNTNFDYKQQLVLAIMKTFTVVLVASMPLIAPASRDLKQAANPPSKCPKGPEGVAKRIIWDSLELKTSITLKECQGLFITVSTCKW